MHYDHVFNGELISSEQLELVVPEHDCISEHEVLLGVIFVCNRVLVLGSFKELASPDS